MNNECLGELGIFIVRAKAATYVGNGEHPPSCRPGPYNLQFVSGQWPW